MNIKSILRNIRFLALLIGNMMMAGCSNSDKPAYLEPHLITTEATHITRTEATLNGSATIEGETEMPKTPVQIRHFGEHEPQYQRGSCPGS